MSWIFFQQPTSDDDTIDKSRQLEQRLATLEALLYDKDAIIHDLQRKLDQKIRVRCLTGTFSINADVFVV